VENSRKENVLRSSKTQTIDSGNEENGSCARVASKRGRGKGQCRNESGGKGKDSVLGKKIFFRGGV